MSYAKFPDHKDFVTKEVLTAADYNAQLDGIQTEMETRTGDIALLDGVITGMALAIDGTSVDVGTGTAYCSGKRYSGSSSIAFTAGDSANTYYLYIDPTNDTSPYAKATADPGVGYLVLGTVAWNGTDTLSSLVDLRPWGVIPWEQSFIFSGTLSAAMKRYAIVPRDVFIDLVQIFVGDTGTTAGSTTVDVHVGTNGVASTTIFTTQANRPSLAYSKADLSVAVSGTPDGDRLIDAGQYLEVVVDAVPTGASSDLAVTVYGRYR